MGLVGSKDDRGVTVLQPLPPGILDEKGRALRNEVDICLEKNSWYFTIAGLALAIPICYRYKTERPFFVAAVLSPMADMCYGTSKCAKETEEFSQHYRELYKRYNAPIWSQQDEALQQSLRPQQQQQQNMSLNPSEPISQQDMGLSYNQKQPGSAFDHPPDMQQQQLIPEQQQESDQQQHVSKRWWSR